MHSIVIDLTLDLTLDLILALTLALASQNRPVLYETIAVLYHILKNKVRIQFLQNFGVVYVLL